MSYLYLLLIKKTHPLRSDCIKSQVVNERTNRSVAERHLLSILFLFNPTMRSVFSDGFFDRVY